MAEQRVEMFVHYLPADEGAGFAFDVGPGDPPTIVIRADVPDTDEHGEFTPLHVYSCLGHETTDLTEASALLADALSEIVGWLRSGEPVTTEGEH